ncbi:MAG TPA: chemotaxis protein CheW [Polyangia bacterium]|nr:chemotaxis protein CheW [Polyangia bacterium]
MSDVHVLCKIAEAEYLLPADHVLQMESFSGATKVPGASAPVAGLVQIRGRVVPVLDLRVVFGFAAIPPTLDSRVVVMQQGKRTVGLLVDSAREIVTIPAADFRPPPTVMSDQSDGFVKAVAQKENRLLMLIDFTKVIGEEHIDE